MTGPDRPAPASAPHDPAGDSPETDFARRMSYTDHPGLDAILTAQKPLSDPHDEMLFIVQHQTSELGMRLALHEPGAARAAILGGELRPAFKMLARVARIFAQLNGARDVLRTVTHGDCTRFRGALGRSSGFRSRQYRLIEFTLGNRNPARLKPHAHRPDLVAALGHPARTVPVAAEVLGRDVARPWRAHDGVHAAWAEVYRAPERHWEAYELAENPVDFEDHFRRWRFNHVTTVERVIGIKRGTGGTSGVPYLRRMLEVELFPELWAVRTEL